MRTKTRADAPSAEGEAQASGSPGPATSDECSASEITGAARSLGAGASRPRRPHTAGPRPREIDTVTRRLSIHEHDTAAEATAEPDPRCPRRVLTGSRTHCAETRVAGKPPDPGRTGREARRPRPPPDRTDARRAVSRSQPHTARRADRARAPWRLDLQLGTVRLAARTAPERDNNRYVESSRSYINTYLIRQVTSFILKFRLTLSSAARRFVRGRVTGRRLSYFGRIE